MIPHPFVARQPLPSPASATSAGAADRTGSPPTQRIVPAVRSLGQCRRSSQGSRIGSFIGARQSPLAALPARRAHLVRGTRSRSVAWCWWAVGARTRARRCPLRRLPRRATHGERGCLPQSGWRRSPRAGDAVTGLVEDYEERIVDRLPSFLPVVTIEVSSDECVTVSHPPDGRTRRRTNVCRRADDIPGRRVSGCRPGIARHSQA